MLRTCTGLYLRYSSTEFALCKVMEVKLSPWRHENKALFVLKLTWMAVTAMIKKARNKPNIAKYLGHARFRETCLLNLLWFHLMHSQ
eukprot:s1252_g30.t1